MPVGKTRTSAGVCTIYRFIERGEIFVGRGFDVVLNFNRNFKEAGGISSLPR